jgi:hypothetical protein
LSGGKYALLSITPALREKCANRAAHPRGPADHTLLSTPVTIRFLPTRAIFAVLLITFPALGQYDAPANYYNSVNVASAIANPALFKDNIHDTITSNYYVPGSTAP